MTRRILFSTIGATPQVVTETIWALSERKPPWRPDEVHIVTTTFALQRIRDALQLPTGRLAAMLDGVEVPPVFIHVPCADGSRFTLEPPRPLGDWNDASGAVRPPENALADVNSKEDATIMGDLILQIMAGFARDNDAEVHLSLAGGRKTMSAHALLAMTLVGRARDEASHVLVSPVEFEDHPEFWHPDQGGKIHHKAELRLKPLPEPTLDPKDAAVTLVPTPTPLVRHQVKDPKAIEDMKLGKIVAEINLAAKLDAAPRVVLDTRRNAVIACDVERVLEPKMFAIYRLLAAARKDDWPGVGPDGEGDGHTGWLTVPHTCIGKTTDGKKIENALLSYMREAVSVSGADSEDQESLNHWRDGVVGARNVDTKVEFAQAWFQSAKTRLPKLLVAQFGAPAAAQLGMRQDEKRRKKTPGQPVSLTGATRFGLDLAPEAIEIV